MRSEQMHLSNRRTILLIITLILGVLGLAVAIVFHIPGITRYMLGFIAVTVAVAVIFSRQSLALSSFFACIPLMAPLASLNPVHRRLYGWHDPILLTSSYDFLAAFSVVHILFIFCLSRFETYVNPDQRIRNLVLAFALTVFIGIYWLNRVLALARS